MKAYMPQYLGSIGIHSDVSKTTNFMMDKYDNFTKIYHLCKEESENISSVKSIDIQSNNPTALSVELTASKNTIDVIMNKIKDENINVNNNIITAS